MNEFIWKSKGQTLLWLENKLSHSSVPKLIVFSYKEWKNKPVKILNIIQSQFPFKKIAIRSSSLNEDSLDSSNAGVFESFLNIEVNNIELVSDTINSVFASYGELPLSNDELIIQEMVDNISVSGVIFTHEMKNRAPYYSINYDDISGSSSTVTSGSSRYSNKTIYIHRDSINGVRSSRFSNLLLSILELEKIFNSNDLDIEFIITKKLEIKIVQVRPIVFKSHISASDYNSVSKSIVNLRNRLKNTFFSEDNNIEFKPIFGQMPDWNPVEMIGIVPRNLAFSLYDTLITNEVWCLSREKMGYSISKNRYLMQNFCGHPFIDVKSSFFTFIPSILDEKISKKLVSFWLDKLKCHNELHDKVEFDIAITTFSFDLNKRVEELPNKLFSYQEKDKIKKAYLKHFCELMHDDHTGSLKIANEEILSLNNELKKIENLNSSSINQLLEFCRKYGTMPFAKLARHAFIGTTLMKSLNTEGILSSSRLAEYNSSIKTILSEMLQDVQNLKNNFFTKIEFNNKYGHLRPGTYDISSKSYREINPTELFGDGIIEFKNKNFDFNSKELNDINQLINFYKLPFSDARGLLNYVTLSIQARESSKFEFTKIIDSIFEKVKKICKKYSIAIDDISYISIERLAYIENIKNGSCNKELLKEITNNKNQHKINTSIRLPQLIMDENHAVVVPFQVSSPNFITNKVIEGRIKYIQNFEKKDDLYEKIVLIESADPGYDWIFTTKFKGLLTKYGGANSHMAIRCAELNIPAAIGCGEELFEHIKKYNQLHLNCSSSIIQPI